MNYRSALQHVRLLLAGDRQAWKYFPYRVRMKIHGVDLSWVSAKDSGLDEKRSHWHSNSGGPELEDLLDTLPIARSDKVLDIGCGKGGALITLSQYPFARVDGVEISPVLARVAESNLKKLRIRNVKIFCADASEFSDLDSYTYFYMYNPFPALVMFAVVQNILNSLKRRDRGVTLIYKNALCHDLLLALGFRKISESQQFHPDYPPFSVYSTDAAVLIPPLEKSSVA
jgi:SAM-dependent methyltransferase